MQQRSAEFTTLFDGFATLRPALLEPMPVAEGRARNVAAADLLAEAEDPAANVGTATKPVTAGQGGGVYAGVTCSGREGGGVRVCVSVRLFVCLSVYELMCVCVCVCLSVCLSVCV